MTDTGMSPREEVQQLIVAHLVERSRFWNAPHGVLDGMTRMPRGGYVRTVTFGVARALDATALVWSPTRIVVEGRGALAQRVQGVYTSLDALIAQLESVETSAA